MEKVRPWRGQPSDRGQLKNITSAEHCITRTYNTCTYMQCIIVNSSEHMTSTLTSRLPSPTGCLVTSQGYSL